MDTQILDPDDIGLSDQETAPLLDVTPETLATWRSQGRGPRYRKDGRAVRYTPRFIREYLNSIVRTPESAKVRRQRRALGKSA
jgi:hypothetical protein